MREENRLDKDTQQNTEQLLQMAKEKLRWFTLEASEEEFDENAVDALVNLIAAMEQKNEAFVDEQKELEYFRAYCEFYEQEEARRRGSVDNKETEKVKPVYKKLRLKGIMKKLHKGKHLGFVAAAAGILLMIAVGGTGAVRAGEDSGFFVWLRKDGEGKFFVTSIGNEDLDVEKSEGEIYDTIEDVPQEYRKYIINKEELDVLQEFDLQGFEKMTCATEERFIEKFASSHDDRELIIGVCIYDSMLSVTEQYDEYELLRTSFIDSMQQDIFMKTNEEGDEDYAVCFYDKDKKFFVQGNCDVKFIEDVSIEYIKKISENATKK